MTGKTKAKKTESKDLVTPYEPTPDERAAMVAYVARKKEKPLTPRMRVSEKGGVVQIAPDHPEAAVAHVLLMEAIGAKGRRFPGWAPQATRQCRNARQDGGRARAQFHALRCEGHRAERPSGGHASGADGRRPQRHHDLRAPARSCGQYPATGQRGAGFQ
jgi:hypothetical protein